MTLSTLSKAPDFSARTTQGEIGFHNRPGDNWGIHFSHKDFTSGCTTGLGYLARLTPEFAGRNCKVIERSADPVGHHEWWLGHINSVTSGEVTYPDANLGIVNPVGPDKPIKATLNYPMSSGRIFDEPRERFPDGWDAVTPNLRVVPQPGN